MFLIYIILKCLLISLILPQVNKFFYSDLISIFTINKFSKTSKSIDNLLKIPKFKLINVYKDLKINSETCSSTKISFQIQNTLSSESANMKESKILTELDLL